MTHSRPGRVYQDLGLEQPIMVKPAPTKQLIPLMVKPAPTKQLIPFVSNALANWYYLLWRQASRLPLGGGGQDAHPTRWMIYLLEIPKPLSQPLHALRWPPIS